MKKISHGIWAAAIISILSAQGAQACWNDDEQAAVKISHLNMMLMVTALRCRGGADNFLPQYNQFVKKNNGLLGSQNAVIRTHFSREMGASRATLALDQMTIGFANAYGGGHHDMDCKALKSLASKVARDRHDISSLSNIAGDFVGVPALPGGQCGARIASRK